MTTRFGVIAVICIGLAIVISIIVAAYWVLTRVPDTTTGMIFIPRPDQVKNPESTLIWFNRNAEKNSSSWGTQLTKFFDQYYGNNTGHAGSTIHCAYGGQAASVDEACLLDITTLNKACSKENANYGYTEGEGMPCVLIKLITDYGWKPEAYKTHQDLVEAKERGMPTDLSANIETIINANSGNPLLDTIWVTCEGKNPADRENIGPLRYYSPAFKNDEFQGIPNYYFPFTNQRNYKAPFVFVKFIKPQLNILIQIECKAWAKNLISDSNQDLGSVHLELMMD